MAFAMKPRAAVHGPKKRRTPVNQSALAKASKVREQLRFPYTSHVKPNPQDSQRRVIRASASTLRAIETGFPVRELHVLSKLESYNKHLYRPASYIHKWWARRLGSVFRTILLSTFSEAGEDIWDKYYCGADLKGRIVLDPFMGGGTTVHEALRLGCKVVGVDYNPVAWWIVRQSITMPDLERLDEAFLELEKTVAPEIRRAYQTRCPICNADCEGRFVLWVRAEKCEKCSSPVHLHESYLIRSDGETKTLVCPSCGKVFSAKVNRAARCQSCKHSFQISEGAAKDGQFVCTQCETWQRVPRGNDTLEPYQQYRMFAIRYRCSVHGESFKQPDDWDLRNYSEVCERVAHIGTGLLVPKERISSGWKTGDLLAHYYKTWSDLFNPRQLLCINLLLREILKMRDEETRMAFITLLSGSLEFNNILCSYKGGNVRRPGAVRHIFSHHAFVFPYEMLENNSWGSFRQSGTFRHLYFARLRKAKEYTISPKERYIEDGRTGRVITLRSERIEGRLASSFEELVSSEKNALLFCRSSERLNLPDKSIDSVISDPPYSDNVQYGELSDFFYVWLRLGLKDKFVEFRPQLVPKEREVVKNPKQGKDGRFYEAGLAAVFRECHRVLKDDGLLVFTFHHKAFEAWVNVLSAVLNGGFMVAAAYPVHSEMPLSLHIHKNKAMSYDSILVCRKRSPVSAISWAKVEQEIHSRGRKAVLELQRAGSSLSILDTFVVVLGKCLEVFSAHYPTVYKEDKTKVSVSEALKTAEKVVQEIVTCNPSTVLRDDQPIYKKKRHRLKNQRIRS